MQAKTSKHIEITDILIAMSVDLAPELQTQGFNILDANLLSGLNRCEKETNYEIL